MNSYPRESVEFCALEVKVDAAAITTYDVQITAGLTRPVAGAWQANVPLDGKHGFMVQNLTPGTYRVWVRIADNPEAPVLELDSIYIS